MGRDWDEVLRSANGTIFQSHAFVTAWLRCYADTASPAVVIAEGQTGIEAILPLATHNVRVMKMKCRVLSPIGVCGPDNMFHNLGAMVRSEASGAEEALASAIAGQRWDLLDLRFLADKNSNEGVKEALGQRWRVDSLPPTACPSIELPEGDVINVIGTRSRRSIRSTLRRLETEERIAFRTVTSPEEVLAVCNEHIDLHKMRWAKKGGSIFSKERHVHLVREMVRIVAERRQGAFYAADIDGKPAARLLCFYDGEWCRAYQLSVNDEFLDSVPGYLIFYEAMKDVQSKGMKRIDFGPGDDVYKFRLGAREAFMQGFQIKRGKLGLAKRVSMWPGISTISRRTGLRERSVESMNE